MNRKSIIIISITGIIIVFLSLLILTYAYYLTRIQGNTNTNSISVTTADLRLVYRDGSANVVETEIEPSNTVYTKEFTVTNEGNVNIDYGVYLVDVINTFERKDDIKYTMSCTTTGSLACNQVTTETTFPNGISEIVTATIEPTKTHTYTFSFTYKDTGTDQSVDMGKELSAKIQIYGENNKGIIVPFESETLAYNIINNASNNLNGTTLDFTDITASKIARQISSSEYGKTNPTIYPKTLSNSTNYYIAYACDYEINEDGQFILGTEACPVIITETTYTYTEELANNLAGKFAYWSTSDITSTTELTELYKITNDITKIKTDSIDYIILNKYISTEKVIATSIDDFGRSYYFRGGVEDNYVNFAGMCWRIVRIAGDGSIKLILEDQDDECESKNGNWNIALSNNSSKKTGYYGMSTYKEGTLLASDGITTNSSGKYVIDYLNGNANSKSISTAFKNFQSQKLTNYLSDLKSGDWCLNNIGYSKSTSTPYVYTKLNDTQILDRIVLGKKIYYYIRNFNDNKYTFKSDGTIINFWNDDQNTNMYVSTLTADEVVYAGGKFGTANYTYYLLNDYQRGKDLYWWTLTASEFGPDYGGSTTVYPIGSLTTRNVYYEFSMRPSINLKSNITISSGVGTINDPYIIKSN